MLIVGTDDSLHEMVADDISLVEVNERKALNILQDVDRFEQAAAPRIGQINLRNIASDHSFGVETQTSHEHFHLLGSCILGFVEDHERIVQGASAHERNGGNLDDTFFQIAI